MDKSKFQEVVSSREVDQKRKEEAMERLAEARQFVEVETEKRRKKREAQERADLELREEARRQDSDLAHFCQIREHGLVQTALFRGAIQ